MSDCDKVVRGLERCIRSTCPSIFSREYRECEYRDSAGHCMQHRLLSDARELLKEQNERIKTLESLRRIEQEGR